MTSLSVWDAHNKPRNKQSRALEAAWHGPAAPSDATGDWALPWAGTPILPLGSSPSATPAAPSLEVLSMGAWTVPSAFCVPVSCCTSNPRHAGDMGAPSTPSFHFCLLTVPTSPSTGRPGAPSQAGANVGMSELWLRTPAEPPPHESIGVHIHRSPGDVLIRVSRSTFHLDSGRTEAPARTELPQASQGRAACSGILHRTPLTLHKRKHPRPWLSGQAKQGWHQATSGQQ